MKVRMTEKLELLNYFNATPQNLKKKFIFGQGFFKIKRLEFIRVARAALFGWSRSRFFGLAPSTAPTPTPTLTLRTVNILFLRDPKYDYDFDDYD